MGMSYEKIKERCEKHQKEKNVLISQLCSKNKQLEKKEKELLLKDEKLEKEIEKSNLLKLEILSMFDDCISDINKTQEKQLEMMTLCNIKINDKLNKLQKNILEFRVKERVNK